MKLPCLSPFCQKRLSLSFRLIPYPLSLIPLLVVPAFSQQRWERTYGGSGYAEGWSAKQTKDGGYIVAGKTNFLGSNRYYKTYKIYLIKTNASGDTLWTRTYGEGTHLVEGYSLQQTTDGGYIIAGATGPFGKSYPHVYLIRTNASGDTLWTKTYGGTGFNSDGNSVQQTTDGGFIVAGGTAPVQYDRRSDVYLIKTDAFGDTLWTRTYGGTGYNYGNSVQQTMDGGFIVAGSYDFWGQSRIYLIKTNASGDTLWTRTCGGEGSEGRAAQQTSDGGYIIVGNTGILGNGWKVCLIKTNALGKTLWTKTYGEAGESDGKSVQQTSDGGYIVAGTTKPFWSFKSFWSFWNGVQVYLIKTNASGDTLWTRTYGGRGEDWGCSVRQTSDGGYIVAGIYDNYGRNPQVYLIKTDANGDVKGRRTGKK